jgi:hypothetical protein
MYGLAKRLVAEGKQPTVILGFNCAADIFYRRILSNLVSAFNRNGRWQRWHPWIGYDAMQIVQTTVSFMPAVQSPCCGQYAAQRAGWTVEL